MFRILPFLTRNGVHKFLQLLLLICLSGVQRGQFALPAELRVCARNIYRHKGDPRQTLQQKYFPATTENLSAEEASEFEPGTSFTGPGTSAQSGKYSVPPQALIYVSSSGSLTTRRYLLYGHLLI
ncbi:hypothetical protein [Rurimicrobium arvi]|uniref:Uncharacterized protein n=1 Tax=Rurimicrobium arvi TaxID=2049916 RepID=A0ABP8MP01_9BACT